MTHGVAYALLAMILFGLADLVYKRAAMAGVQARHFLMVQAWCFAPSAVLYALYAGSPAFDARVLWGAAAGFFAFVGLYNFARSLKDGAVSINAPVFRMNFAVTAALAIVLLGEPLTAYKFTGLVLALISVWLLLGSGAAADLSSRRESLSSLAQVLFAMLVLGIANFLYKVGLRAGSDTATLLAAQAAVFMPLATIFSAMVDRGIRPPKPVWPYAAITAVLLVLASVFLLEGLARGEASVLVPVAQMGFVFTALLSFVFLREPFTARKGAGLAFAIAALVCLGQAGG